jgi:hypothetical protein
MVPASLESGVFPPRYLGLSEIVFYGNSGHSPAGTSPFVSIWWIFGRSSELVLLARADSPNGRSKTISCIEFTGMA